MHAHDDVDKLDKDPLNESIVPQEHAAFCDCAEKVAVRTVFQYHEEEVAFPEGAVYFDDARYMAGSALVDFDLALELLFPVCEETFNCDARWVLTVRVMKQVDCEVDDAVTTVSDTLYELEAAIVDLAVEKAGDLDVLDFVKVERLCHLLSGVVADGGLKMGLGAGLASDGDPRGIVR